MVAKFPFLRKGEWIVRLYTDGSYEWIPIKQSKNMIITIKAEIVKAAEDAD